ncbi:AMIN domain-containing protein [Tolypothrix sp. FACHB-123]|uniref:AMIN domain-containing protein n=1 Tax=Tolypothrix sp. FACHB-123 TaxID=2692868 RepID=UPI001689F7FB|nr:AMIN domain-containing protein [Tolypothrix sp. FACHB-123]MBD2357304.1 AMIN domain-containing protein [Tolypothrix sp. FACHB-123]
MEKSLKTKQFCQLCTQLFGISWFGVYTVVSLQAGSAIALPLTKQLPAPYSPNLPPPIGGRNLNTPLATLDNWRFSPEALQLEFSLSSSTTPNYFYLAQPPRIVVDLPNTKLGYVPTQQNYSGAIQRVRVSQLNAAVTRIVLDLAPGTYVDPNQVKLQPASLKNPTRWVLRGFNSGYRNPVQPRNYPQQPNALPPIPSNYPQQPNNLPVIPYNYPQQTISQPTTNNQQVPFLTLPPPSNALPAIPTNQQQPLVVVPPLTSHNQSQLPNPTLPPPIVVNQPSNFGNPTPITQPNFPVPTLPQSPPNFTEAPVIEFGQPIPKMRN